LRRYESSFSPWSTGWDSTYPRTFPASQRLQAEAHLLGRAFDRLIAVLPLDHRRQTPTFTFAHTDYSLTMPALLPSGIPDLQALFGSLAPRHPATYATTCNIHRRHDAEFTICLDTGCSMSSTPSLDDFEEPPVKGKFGHLRTINHVVPIEAAGLIRWNVLDSEGKPAVIRVPGYFIPSSGQRLLSPQSYAAYHKWADPTKDCYGGNDRHVWLHLAPDSTDSSQSLTVPISALDGLPYIPGLPSPLPDAAPCSSGSCHCASCSHAYNLSILSPENENLTAAQKSLLLDHHRLGHIGLDHLRTLYRCPTPEDAIISTTSSPVPSPCTPCLIPKHPQVLSCSTLRAWPVMWPKLADGHATPVI